MDDMELQSKLEALAAQGEAAFARIGEHALANMPTLRDRFAMAALTGILPLAYSNPGDAEIAKLAYEIADAMLAARGGSK